MSCKLALPLYSLMLRLYTAWMSCGKGAVEKKCMASKWFAATDSSAPDTVELELSVCEGGLGNCSRKRLAAP